MARIVNMEEVLPEDIEFHLPGGQKVFAPGDPPLELILRIADLFERSQNAGEDDEAIGLEVLNELDAQVMRLLQMRDPDLTAQPFGVVGVQHFVAECLKQYGFAEETAEDPPPRAASSRKRSPRSSGSRSSSRRSASSRTTGAA